jgi:hypothetical protein
MLFFLTLLLFAAMGWGFYQIFQTNPDGWKNHGELVELPDLAGYEEVPIAQAWVGRVSHDDFRCLHHHPKHSGFVWISFRLTSLKLRLALADVDAARSTESRLLLRNRVSRRFEPMSFGERANRVILALAAGRTPFRESENQWGQPWN